MKRKVNKKHLNEAIKLIKAIQESEENHPIKQLSERFYRNVDGSIRYQDDILLAIVKKINEVIKWINSHEGKGE